MGRLAAPNEACRIFVFYTKKILHTLNLFLSFKNIIRALPKINTKGFICGILAVVLYFEVTYEKTFIHIFIYAN